LLNKESESTQSAFQTRPEKTTQFDFGSISNVGRLSLSLSGFYNQIDDYILIQSEFSKTTIFGTYTTTITRNVEVHTWGGELGAAYALTDQWKLDGSLAYVRGENDTDNRPLAQMPPMEGRLGLNYDDKIWSLGSLLRLVEGQDRVAINQGNIAGQDIGKSNGFAIFSLNAGWRPKPGMLIAAGVDNLFDKTYAEAISKGGAMLSGFTQTTRINEPGRMLWLKGSINF
jgi:iron complex outermembrane receptor protein